MELLTGNIIHLAMSAPETTLVHDLGIVLAAAALVALLFQYLKLPLIFGYMLAGMLLGPNIFPDPIVRSLDTVQELSELGVVFLLFFIGLEFNLQRVSKIIGPALLALILQTIGMVYLAKLFGPILGWDSMKSIFFGCVLAISSSMVTVRVLRDLNRMKLPHANLSIGILILEDILAVILLVVLTGVAVNKRFEWEAAWLLTFVMGIFVVVVYYVGKLVAPRILKMLEKTVDMELLTIFTVGFVLGIGVLALQLNFSLALGAFLAGAILSDSRLADKIEQANKPIHDLFSAIFFVSIGVLIDPLLLLENIKWIALLTVLVIFGKIFTCYFGLFLSGQPSRTSFRASVAKAQIGEFSFIIAELGRNLGVTNDQVTGIAFGVALFSILLTPVLSRPSEEIHSAIASRIPSSIQSYGKFYQSLLRAISGALSRNAFIRLSRRPMMQITAYFFILNGIIFGASMVTGMTTEMDYYSWISAGIWVLAAVLCTPFLIAIIRNVNALVFMLMDATFASSATRPMVQGRIRGILNAAIFTALMALAGGLFLSAAASHLPKGTALLLFSGLIIVLAAFFWAQMIRLNSRLEFMFMEGFNQQTRTLEQERRDAVMQEISQKYPWPVNLLEIDIAPGTVACGKSIAEISLREKTGANVIALGRDGHHLFDPNPETTLFPHDQLIVLGTEEQNRRALSYLSNKRKAQAVDEGPGNILIERVYLDRESKITDDTLAGANIRRRYNVNIVGIQRGKNRITSPKADEILKAGDVLIVVGQQQDIERFRGLTELNQNNSAG